MKKIVIYILVIFILTGCNQINMDNNDIDFIDKDIIINDENIYIDTNPIKVGLYIGSSKITSYTTTLSNHKEIGVFNIYYTDKDRLDSSNIKYNFNKYYNEYNNIDDYKIGFYVTFEADDKKIEEIISDPSSKHSMTPYLYIYLYDDIHQKDGAWYSHLEMNDINDDTVYSSIKLYLAQEGSKITSPISLTVFTYNNLDDFDSNGYYIGNSKYTIEIDTK